ncbi:MAG: DUF1697 domain-containing protein [Bacteroidota bacterium]
MNRYIALLRGINVGGHKKIKMADLRALMESRGFSEVVTYIQSGNMAFSSQQIVSSELISQLILDGFGWEVPVLLTTPQEIREILDACPFPKEKKEQSYFMLLFEPPSEENMAITKTYEFPNEEYFISPRCAYHYCSDGYRNSKMGAIFEKKLKVPTTSRNYRTMVKLLDIASLA